MVNALLLSSILWPYLDHLIVLGWLGAILLVSFFRLILFLRYRRVETEELSVLSWERPYFLILFISSLIWGLGGVWMMSMASLLQQAIIYSFLIGMAGGAISVYSAVQALVLKIVGALLVPATAWLLLQGTMTPVFLGIGGTLFILSGIRATKILSEALHRSFYLNHQLTAAKERAEVLARTDFLTGLSSRGHFTEVAEMQARFCRRHQYPISVIVLDIDDFKAINDSKGHHFGDLALQHLSTILKQSIRKSDVCGRIGGEEFAILLPNADADDATTTAEKIRRTIEKKPVETQDGEFSFTVSLGIATGNIDAKQLLRMADKAMYRAKKTGRNMIRQYDPTDDSVSAAV